MIEKTSGFKKAYREYERLFILEIKKGRDKLSPLELEDHWRLQTLNYAPRDSFDVMAVTALMISRPFLTVRALYHAINNMNQK